MPECDCGRFVTERYVRVFSPEGVDGVRCCPDCDVIRDGSGGTREKRSVGGHVPEYSEFDAELAADGGNPR
jgi:hypothetical protein